MKRFILVVLFFYCSSLSYPAQVRAAAPLALLAAATVGATVLATGGTYYALKNPSSHSFNGHTILSDMWAYRKVESMGKEFLLGQGVTGALDLARAVREGALNSYQSLKSLLDSFLDENTGPAPWQPGDVISYGNKNIKLGEPYQHGNRSVAYWDNTSPGWTQVSGTNPPLYVINYYLYRYLDRQNCYFSGETEMCAEMYVPGEAVTDPVNYPSEDPEEWGDDMAPSLAADINQALQAGGSQSIAVGQDLVDLQKDRPGLWAISNSAALPVDPTDISDYPPAQPITPADINQWAQAQGATAQQVYIDTLNDLIAANPTNAELAAELARAQAEQAQQEAEDIQDSFDAISDNPFEVPYNPGAFDISARFTTFLNNVKSTGLFSFSSSFFNSLPGGGSPIYTVDAGTYGTHTIDLSETMATGLAVLKTVLLLLFGFLSIRVVILKR